MSFVGPALPPHLRRRQEDSGEQNAEKETADEEEKKLYSPALPPQIQRRPEDDTVKKEAEAEDAEEEQAYGPALPPHLTHKKNKSPVEDERTSGKRIVGPALPPGDQKADQDSDSESDDEGVIGPLPPGAQHASYSAADEFERRAHTMKNKLTKKDEVEQPTRETWMLELPEVRSQAFGLGPRTFNRVTKPEIVGREEWTQAPNTEPPKNDDKKQKDKEAASLRQAQERKRNSELEAVIKEHDSKRRKETLMEIHEKERKRKLEEEGKTVKERVPFDRDRDLQTNKLDEAKRKAFIQRSKQLDGRFAGGSQKFL